jgi:acyl dehydratase
MLTKRLDTGLERQGSTDMAEPRVFTSAQELRAAVGEQLGHSDWLEVDQKRIDLFAEATGDHQWIHVDPEQAAKGPFGTTIAHGYLTLSLLPVLVPQILSVQNVTMGVNYGANKVRFPAPVPSGSRVRATAVLKEITEAGGGVQVTAVVTVEREGGEKPVCVAESVSRYYF